MICAYTMHVRISARFVLRFSMRSCISSSKAMYCFNLVSVFSLLHLK